MNEILKGWNSLPWGAPLADFKAKFPKATEGEGGRWLANQGDETLAGVKVKAEYGFNKKGQLQTVRLTPTADGKTFRKTLVEAGVAREGDKPNWQNAGVSFVVAEVDGEQFVLIVAAKFADPKEPAAKK